MYGSGNLLPSLSITNVFQGGVMATFLSRAPSDINEWLGEKYMFVGSYVKCMSHVTNK